MISSDSDQCGFIFNKFEMLMPNLQNIAGRQLT